MTRIHTTGSQQAATVTPSPPAVVVPDASVRAAPQEPQKGAAGTAAPKTAQPPAADAGPHGAIAAMKAAAQQIETYLRSVGRDLEFRVDEDTGRTVITVRDAQTGETVRQIPGEEVLRLARTLGEKSGTLIDLAV